MLPRGGQLLIGREAGEIEGHFLLSEKNSPLKNTAIHQESNVKAEDLKKVHSLQLHRDLHHFASLLQENWLDHIY